MELELNRIYKEDWDDGTIIFKYLGTRWVSSVNGERGWEESYGEVLEATGAYEGTEGPIGINKSVAKLCRGYEKKLQFRKQLQELLDEI